MPRAIKDYVRGDKLTAARLNETVTAVRDLQRIVQPEQLESVDQDAAEPPEVNEQWIFVAKTTVTERIEDADDSEVYIDVERTTSVVLERPDGSTVLIQLEDLGSG